MNEDMTNLETELRSLLPQAPGEALIGRIGATFATKELRVSRSDWIMAGTMLAGAASAVVVAVLLTMQGGSQQSAWRRTVPPPQLVQWRQTRTDPYLAILGRRNGISSAEFAGLLYP